MFRRKPKAISAKSTARASSRVIFFFFGLIFAAAGIGVFIGLAGFPLSYWFAAQGWNETPCTILQSEVLEHPSSDGDTYSVHIVYSYFVDGRNYQSNRYNFMGGSSSGRRGKEAVIARYPEGRDAVCYVNPGDPNDAILSRAFSAAYLIGLFGVPFFLVGFGLFITSFRQKRPAAGISGGAVPGPVRDLHIAPSGTITLKPSAGGWAKLIAVSCFAALWNGFIGGIFLLVPREELGLTGTLFLFPFVLVGLALIAGVAYCFLAIFNPRIQFRISPGAIPLGGTADLEWTVLGSTNRIQRLRIWLEGREQAKYRRGTDTYTDESTFEYIPIAEATDPRDMRIGRVQLAIPEFTMHSFDAPNNKIRWRLMVHGDVPRWPDIQQEYDLIVLPLPPATGNG